MQNSIFFFFIVLLSCNLAFAETGNTQANYLTVKKQLTADEIATFVLAANPGLQRSEVIEQIAEYQTQAAGRLEDPTFGYALAPLSASADRSLNQRLDFKQVLPWPGTLASRKSAAQYTQQSAKHSTGAKRLELIAITKSAWAEWHYVHESIAVHHKTHRLLKELIETARTRYAAGNSPRQDVLQAEIELADLDNHFFQLEQEVLRIQSKLNALLDRPSDAPIPSAAPISTTKKLPMLAQLQHMATTHHPELLAMGANIAIGDAHIELAEKAFYPDFAIGVSYNSLWDDTDKRPVFGVSMNIPLDRKKRRAELGAAKASKHADQLALEEHRANLQSVVSQLYAKLLETNSSISLFEDRLLPLAKDYLSAALADYQSGDGTFLSVITAEQRLLADELSLARTRANYIINLAHLERWTGQPVSQVEASNGEVQ